MFYIINNYNKLKWIFISFSLLLFSVLVYSNIGNEENKADVMRFDAVIELNAPRSGASVLLFARYWVARDFYSIGFKWAEPQVGNINFPTYPPGFIINSNEKDFSTSSQVYKSHNKTYTKPVEERGIFNHALGSYPIANIRFAEPEAQACRIYKKDLESSSEPNNNQMQTVEIKDSNDSQSIKRSVKKLEIKKSNGNIDNLRVFDVKGALLKDIKYEYSEQDGKTMLKHESVLMPEMRMPVGFNGKGVTITLAGQKKTFTELQGFHHTGTRKCDIEYEAIKTDKGFLSVPSSIVVKRADVDYILRTVKMSNFVQIKMSSQEARQEAQEFSRLNENELKVRDLLEKCWLKEPEDINETDTKQLVRLHREFKNTSVDSTYVPDKLKNTNMLLNLDWIQDDPNLENHFEKYMKILKENKLPEMVLTGGLNVIDMTAGWKRYSDADKLMQKWIENAVPLFNPVEILRFAEIQMSTKKYWIIINLLGSFLDSSNDLGTARFDIQAMKCTAFDELNKLIEDTSKIKQDSIHSQFDWVLNSTTKENLIKTMSESLNDANKSYSELKEPNRIQISIKKKLDQLYRKDD